MLNENKRTSKRESLAPYLPLVGSGFNPSPFLNEHNAIEPYYRTDLGAMYDLDCQRFLSMVRDECVDTIFCDPPFNLKKTYGKSSDDDMPPDEYISWCKSWIDEGYRCLKPGGAFFLYNIPKWNILLGAYMAEIGLVFRHWIAISIKLGLPIPGRLYPSHYSLIYYTKGKPRVFRRVRTPILRCRHCGGEIRDYGGHRGAMNPKGVNLTDVWDDIPPVRHWKYKSTKRRANALSSKILDRVIEISTRPGDLVIDPFGGSGTTFAVSEVKHRHWLGTDIDFAPVVKERLSGDLFLHKCEDVLDV